MNDEPKEATGHDWSGVASVGTESEASFIVGFLESRGIPTRLVDKSFSQNPVPADEDLSDIEVAVPSDRFAEAAAALEKRDEAFASATEGEATLMTDEGPAEIDPTENGSN
ncbi:MAG: hypothetical protein IPP07_18265 [Holophagales bacterium]|nr:hypothetical protein [Holophagales bacterium]